MALLPRHVPIGLAALAVLGAILALMFWRALHPPPPQGATPQTPSPSQSGAATTPAMPHGALSVDGQLNAVLGKLRANTATAADLETLRGALLADPAAGIAAIRAFLATGADAATGQALSVGPGGVLAGAPTLRLFLLDLLGQLARQSGSSVGAALSRSILEKKESPDEWALALRNVAWAEPGARPYLAAKMRELLAYQPWMASPTAGLMEAFDVVVYSGDPGFVPELNRLASGPDGGLRQAATVALDRLAERSPLAVMHFLNSNPGAVSDRPMVRADYFAKADLRDPAQAAALEQYLARADTGLGEKRKLLHALPAPGSFVGESLLQTAAQPLDDTGRDAAIARAAAGWLQSNRFPALRPDLEWLLATASEPQ